jgi:flagellar basal body-associated protein FliL
LFALRISGLRGGRGEAATLQKPWSLMSSLFVLVVVVVVVAVVAVVVFWFLSSS